MAAKMRIAKRREQWTELAASSTQMQEAFYTIIFDIFGCDYGAINESEIDEYSDCYEVLRDSLESVRYSIIHRDAMFLEHDEAIEETLESVNSSLEEFIALLRDIIVKSDQENEWIYISWF